MKRFCFIVVAVFRLREKHSIIATAPCANFSLGTDHMVMSS